MSFLGNDGGSGKFADYTMLGVDKNGVYVSTNNFTTSNTPDGGDDSMSIYSIPKSDLLAAKPTLANMSSFTSRDAAEIGFVPQPITNFGPSPQAGVLATSFANPR